MILKDFDENLMYFGLALSWDCSGDLYILVVKIPIAWLCYCCTPYKIDSGGCPLFRSALVMSSQWLARKGALNLVKTNWL